MIKLTKVYLVESMNKGLYKLKKLLSDENVKMIPLIINPPVMPGKEEMDFYKKHIDPIINATGMPGVKLHFSRDADVIWKARKNPKKNYN